MSAAEQSAESTAADADRSPSDKDDDAASPSDAGGAEGGVTAGDDPA